MNESESFLVMAYTEVLETNPRTRSLRLRQKQSIEMTPRSIIQTKKLICDLCDKNFKSKILLVKHMQSIHLPKITKSSRNAAKSDFNCKHCVMK